MNTDWSGKIVEQARALLVRRLPAPCAVCGVVLTPTDRWNVGHIKSRISFPHLVREPSNWQLECRKCSDSGGQRAVQEKAARDALISAGIDPNTVFTDETKERKSPPLSKYPPRAQSEHDDVPSPDIAIPSRLLWSSDELRKYDWLAEFADVPENAAAPLAMTPPHPDATGSYGREAIAFIEASERIRDKTFKSLRWWQRLAITRQLEFDPLGRLVWRTVLESGPRRIGKSVRLRGMAMWRMQEGAALFGEPDQLVIHTGMNLQIVSEIQLKARRAAEAYGWKVSKGRGNEYIETQTGDRWLGRATSACNGNDVMLGMVDEAWDVQPGVVDEDLEPTMLERQSPQLHLTSTAHRKATSLMKRRISDAMAVDDGKTLLMLWAAPPGADPGDPTTWKAASAHWSTDRAETIANKYAKALAGEADPELDDPDPMAGFASQYLNVWRLRETARTVGDPVIEEPAWTALGNDLPASTVEAVAVEGWPGEGLSVAVGRRLGDRVVVSVEDVPDVATAAALVAAYGCSRPVLVGASMITDPAWGKQRTKSTTGTINRAVADLSRLLKDGVFLHDRGELLSAQVLGLRTSPGPEGIRIRSAGRADAVKAAVWAAQEARTKSVGKPRILFV